MNRRNLIRIVFILLSPFLLLITACEHDFLTSNAISENSDPYSLTKKTKIFEPLTGFSNTIYPLSSSIIVNFKQNRNIYRGFDIDLLPSNSVFDVDGGSLTPPPSINWGDPVEITFSVDKDTVNNELIFTFGPHGCQFDPAARVIMDYAELGIDFPTLYYIADDGTYIEHTPEYIDINGKWLTIYIDHFSRYAVAYGR